MSDPKTVLMVIAALLLLVAAIGYPSPQPPASPRFSLGWLGMFFFVIAQIVH